MRSEVRAYRRAVFILLLLALLLQMIALAAPGWIITTDSLGEVYVGTFYITNCRTIDLKTSCETKSKVGIHKEEISETISSYMQASIGEYCYIPFTVAILTYSSIKAGWPFIRGRF